MYCVSLVKVLSYIFLMSVKSRLNFFYKWYVHCGLFETFVKSLSRNRYTKKLFCGKTISCVNTPEVNDRSSFRRFSSKQSSDRYTDYDNRNKMSTPVILQLLIRGTQSPSQIPFAYRIRRTFTEVEYTQTGTFFNLIESLKHLNRKKY